MLEPTFPIIHVKQILHLTLPPPRTEDMTLSSQAVQIVLYKKIIHAHVWLCADWMSEPEWQVQQKMHLFPSL